MFCGIVLTFYCMWSSVCVHQVLWCLQKWLGRCRSGDQSCLFYKKKNWDQSASCSSPCHSTIWRLALALSASDHVVDVWGPATDRAETFPSSLLAAQSISYQELLSSPRMIEWSVKAMCACARSRSPPHSLTAHWSDSETSLRYDQYHIQPHW